MVAARLGVPAQCVGQRADHGRIARRDRGHRSRHRTEERDAVRRIVLVVVESGDERFARRGSQHAHLLQSVERIVFFAGLQRPIAEIRRQLARHFRRPSAKGAVIEAADIRVPALVGMTKAVPDRVGVPAQPPSGGFRSLVAGPGRHGNDGARETERGSGETRAKGLSHAERISSPWHDARR